MMSSDLETEVIGRLTPPYQELGEGPVATIAIPSPRVKGFSLGDSVSDTTCMAVAINRIWAWNGVVGRAAEWHGVAALWPYGLIRGRESDKRMRLLLSRSSSIQDEQQGSREIITAVLSSGGCKGISHRPGEG